MRLLGYEAIEEVGFVKVYEMKVNLEDQDSARSQLDEIARRLLANPVINDYRVELL